jgi:hypothetical protein
MEYKRSTKMNLADIVKTLPPLVYLRGGALIVQFSTPGDFVARDLEGQED